MPNEFAEFRKRFKMDYNYVQNYIQYWINNRKVYANWLKVFGTPCLIFKLKKEPNKPIENNEFSEIDKNVIAYGKSGAAFEETPTAYDIFQVYLPIINESFNRVNAEFPEQLVVYTPIDERFSYSKSDILVFKHNDWIFKYEIALEPSAYSGIAVELSLRYVDKKSLLDNIQTDPDEKEIDESKYWK
jgi:hypothetical protein